MRGTTRQGEACRAAAGELFDAWGRQAIGRPFIGTAHALAFHRRKQRLGALSFSEQGVPQLLFGRRNPVGQSLVLSKSAD